MRDQSLGFGLKEKYQSLDDVDISVLKTIELEEKRIGIAPLEYLEAKRKISHSSLMNSIKKLLDLKLIRSENASFYGYKVTYAGLDMLALDFYFKKNIISDIGDRINTGKESDIYISVLPTGKKSIIKFHREGRISFRAIKRKRNYNMENVRSWLHLAERIAKREYVILEDIWKGGGLVPTPIAYNRHSIIMSKIDGIELYKLKMIDIRTIFNVINDVVKTLAIAYRQAKIIHGDVNQYNVLVSNEQIPKGYIIDWPQYVPVWHRGAECLLRRDIEYLASYLHKKFGLDIDREEVLKKIKGGS